MLPFSGVAHAFADLLKWRTGDNASTVWVAGTGILSDGRLENRRGLVATQAHHTKSVKKATQPKPPATAGHTHYIVMLVNNATYAAHGMPAFLRR